MNFDVNMNFENLHMQSLKHDRSQKEINFLPNMKIDILKNLKVTTLMIQFKFQEIRVHKYVPIYISPYLTILFWIIRHN